VAGSGQSEFNAWLYFWGGKMKDKLFKELEEKIGGLSCFAAEPLVKKIIEHRQKNIRGKIPLYMHLILRYYTFYQREKIISGKGGKI